MIDREKQIEEMARTICPRTHGSCNDCACIGLCENKDIATDLYNAGYRKMDEITLKLDLGDRSAEEIQQIAEAFEKAMANE